MTDTPVAASNTSYPADRIAHAAGLAMACYLLLRVGACVIQSFSWPMDGDLSFLYYISWLMNDHGFVPYRDVHETSFFGTFIFYSTLTKLVGYSTLAFHIVDTVYFALLSCIVWLLLKPFGRIAGLLAIGLFGECYYQVGVGVHLQRDFVALLPVALAILLSQASSLAPKQRSVLVGILFGMASCIKPQFALALIPVMGMLCLQLRLSLTASLACAVYALAGLVLMWILGFAWLYAHGVVGGFLDMTMNYLPEYNRINGRNFARLDSDAWLNGLWWLWGRFRLFALPILASVAGIMSRWKQRRHDALLVLALASVWLCYLLYVPMAGKYWEYHILPSNYFLALLLALVVCDYRDGQQATLVKATSRLVILAAWMVFCWFAILHSSLWIKPKINDQFNDNTAKATAELAEFLKKNLRPGDHIQSHVSHTHGPIFPALLEARALPATPYLENYLLYHAIDTPFVIHARESFLARLKAQPPKYIIVTPTVFRFQGDRTEMQFDAFEQWFANNYHVVFYSSNTQLQGITEVFFVYGRNVDDAQQPSTGH